MPKCFHLGATGNVTFAISMNGTILKHLAPLLFASPGMPPPRGLLWLLEIENTHGMTSPLFTEICHLRDDVARAVFAQIGNQTSRNGYFVLAGGLPE